MRIAKPPTECLLIYPVELVPDTARTRWLSEVFFDYALGLHAPGVGGIGLACRAPGATRSVWTGG